MVAPSSFDSPISPLAAALLTGATPRAGITRGDAQRPNATQGNPSTVADQPTGIPRDAPIRGDRPVSQSLSTTFVAQFIAQEIDPRPTRPRDPVETSRAFDAFRQANANAARLDNASE